MERKKLPFYLGITIDDVTSRDLDDGFWITEEHDHFLLQIFISDVAQRVNPHAENKKLYMMAYSRIETQYYRNHHDPMLPIKLSEDELSLLPGKTRKVLGYTFKLNKDTLEIKDLSIEECLFKSIRKLSYFDVQDFLQNQNEVVLAPKIQTVLTIGNRIAQKLLMKRREQGALILYDINNTFVTTEEGRLIFISKRKHRGYIIIQELMTFTNYSVADFAVKNKIPLIFRTHRVRDTNIEKSDLLREFNLLKMTLDPKALQNIQYRIDHMLDRAEYNAKHGEHWALSLPWYTHVTSPIRRFADLVNELNLIAYVRKVSYPFPYEALEIVAAHTNNRIKEHLRQRKLFNQENAEQELPEFEEEWIQKVGSLHFSRYIKLLAEGEGHPSEVFTHEIERRLDEDTLGIRDFVRILFSKKFDDQKLIRTKTLRLLCEHKTRIKPVFNHYCQLLNAKVPEIVFAKENNMFSSLLSFKAENVSYDVGPALGRSKHEASEEVYLLLLCKIFQISPLLIAKQTTGDKKNQEEIKQESIMVKITPVIDENYIGTLQEMCQKSKLETPTYVFRALKVLEGKTKFKCTAEAKVGSEKYQAKNTGSNKKEAKAAAAKTLYEQLVQVFGNK